MKLKQAQKTVSEIRLDAVATQRLDRYVKNLASGKKDNIFDDRMHDYLKTVVVNSDKLKAEKNYLDGMGFTQGQSDYKMLEEQLLNFQVHRVPDNSYNRNLQQAVRTVTAEFEEHLRSLQYESIEDVKDAIPRKDTHAGWSYITTGKRHKGEYLEDMLGNLNDEIRAAKKNRSFNKPILIGVRMQAGGAYTGEGIRTKKWKMKPRLVSMIDVYQVMAETKFAKPIQGWLSRIDWYAGGKTDDQINAIIQRYRQLGYHMITIDYSKFDQSITRWMIRLAFGIVKHAFRNDTNFDEELFDIIVNDFIFKVFVDGKGNLVYADKGVPSGSMFTQIIDSIVNRLMILTYANAKGIKIEHMIIMGDDNLIFTSERIDAEDLSGYLMRVFGAEVNPDKCSQTEPYGYPEFLSRFWYETGTYRPQEILIQKLLFPESRRPYDREPELTPELILYSFWLSFPYDMHKFIKEEPMRLIRQRNYTVDSKKAARWMSGVERYRRLYLSAS